MRRAPSSPPDLPGYTSLQLLGSGGFADVFLYEQRLPRRKVAVKVLLTEELGRDTRAQFVAEANLMAQLSAHPFIVTIFHADVSADGRPYFVMEYCSGPSLAERYKREPFAVEDALRTGIRLAGAVATAHAAGILHRDIKPANVLTNDYGWPALTDFGISSNLEGELPVHTVTAPADASATSSGQSAVGMSVPWSPAEMFEDDPRPDQRSDLFSLAATVHTLLAGRTPFEIPGRPNGSLDLIGRIERGAITPIDRADVPRSLVSVLAKAMSVRRDDRYPTAIEFARALQRIELELGYAATEHRGAEPRVGAHDVRRRRGRHSRTCRARRRGAAAPGRAAGRRRDAGARAASGRGAARLHRHRADARRGHRAPTRARRASGRRRAGGRRRDRRAAGEARCIRGVARRRHPGATAAGVAGGDRRRGRTAESTSTRRSRSRSRAGTIVAVAAGAVVVAAIGIAVALSGTLDQGAPDPTRAPTGEDAIVAATVPAPVVEPGTRSADGTAVVFPVSHAGAEDGDRYRWQRADGSGSTEVTDESSIVVAGVDASERVCIEVQVQRGSKTSEAVTGCTP